jgi:hypothetical protein
MAAGTVVALVASGAEAQTIDLARSRLVEPKSKTFQDVINYPNKFDAQLLQLMGSVDGAEPPVTAGQKQRFRDIETEWARHQAAAGQVLGPEVEAFNARVRALGVPAIVVPK